MAKQYLMALDEGTSSARTLIFSPDGQIVGLGRANFRQIYPKPGWVEHEPDAIWDAQFAACTDALGQAGLSWAQITAIGITNQRETTVAWDAETGQPVHNAIVWQDRRTADYCAQLKSDGVEPLVQTRTGLLLDPYFSATKLRWILENVPAARSLADRGQLRFGTIDTWLLWKLTSGKVHATDASNAARTLLFNIHTLQWDDELLRLFGIPASVLPTVRPSAWHYGDTQLGMRIPIMGIAGDQQAATFGQACFVPGQVKNTYGTGCFILKNIGAKPLPSQHKLLTTIAWQVGAEVTYAFEGAIFSAGASLQWLESIGLYGSIAEMDQLASSVPDSADAYLVPAFAGLGAPQWDPNARGTLVGLTRGTTKAHLIRAALEAMAYQSDEVLQAMEQDSGLPTATMRVDGGVSANNMLMQFQAELSGCRIERPRNTETTALGAAFLAGLQAGVYSSLDDLQKCWQAEQSFVPAVQTAEGRARSRARWQEAVRRSLNWAE